MLTVPHQIAVFTIKHVGFLRKKFEKNYKGFKFLQKWNLLEEKNDFNYIYFSALSVYESDNIIHPLLIELFSEVSSKNAFKNDFYNNEGSTMVNDMGANIQINEKYTDLKNIGIDLKKEIDSYRKIFTTIINKSKSPLEIEHSGQLEYIAKIVSGINLPADNFDLSGHISEISNLRTENKHGAVLRLLKNFLEKEWSSLSNEIKYKIILNIAITYFELDNKSEGAKYFIRLPEFGVKENEALGLAALGYALIDDTENAIKLANKALITDNRNENAYLALFFTGEDSLNQSEIDLLIPVAIRDSPSIAINLAAFKDKQGDYDGAFEMLQKLDEKETSFNTFKIDVQVLLATNRIKVVENKDDYIFNQLDDNALRSIKYAFEKLTSVWDKIKNTDLQNSRSYILTNRGVTQKILGNTLQAEQDFKSAFDLSKTYFTARHLLLLKVNEPPEYKKWLNEIKRLSLTEEEKQEVLLFTVQQKDRSFSDDDYFRKMIGDLPNLYNKEIECEYYNFIIDTYLQIGQIGEAEKYAMPLSLQYPLDPFCFYKLFEVFQWKGMPEKAMEFLAQAKGLINSTSPRMISMIIADLYIKFNDFLSAIEVLEKVANVSKPSLITKKLIFSYYNNGNYKDAVNIADNLIALYPDDVELVDQLTAILEILEQYNKAIIILNTFLLNHPHDKIMKVKLAINYYKNSDFDLAAKTLDSISGYTELPINAQFLIADAYVKSKNYIKGFELAYQILFANPGEAIVFQTYMQIKMAVNHFAKEVYFPVSIIKDSYVSLISEIGKKLEFIIVDFPKYNNEISANEKLSQSLIGKSINDTIEIGDELYTINSILWKYTYALHYCMNMIQARFNDGPVRVMNFKPNGSPQEMLSKIFKSVDEGIKTDKILEGLYQSGKSTVGANASLSRLSAIKYWQKLTHSPDTGVHAMGTLVENQTGIGLIKTIKPIILDITAILSLHHVGLLKQIKKIPNKIYIVQSTVDLIKNEIELIESGSHTDHMNVNKIDGQYLQEVITVEEKNITISKLKEFLKLSEESAEIIPAPLTNNFAEKEKRDKVLGKSFNEAAVTAYENNLFLISDDTYFRSLCYNEFHVNGISVITFSDYLVLLNIISVEERINCLKKFINLNYRFVPVNEFILLDICTQNNFEVKQPFINACDIVDASFLYDYDAIRVCGNFIYLLYSSTTASLTRPFVTQFILQKLFNGRDNVKIKNLLIPYIAIKFRLLQLQLDEVMNIIIQCF